MRKEKKNRKEKRKEKKRRRKRKQIERKRIRREKERKRRKKEKGKGKFLAFGRSKFYSSRTKVGARSAIYVWTPKSWSFDKLREVGVLSYLSYTLFKCFVDD